ncbi:MAG: leucine zipper domain-containing protein [Acidobacteriota bacterium]
MNEKMKFIVDYERREVSLAVLCRQYGISRVAGYKWLKRYEVEGIEGLKDRSRAPKHHPQAVPGRLENAIVEVRHQHR